MYVQETVDIPNVHKSESDIVQKSRRIILGSVSFSGCITPSSKTVIKEDV